jgi:hypothetical protein
MSTFSIRERVLGTSEEVALVSKRTAFLLRGKKRRVVPLSDGVSRDCGRNADRTREGVREGARKGAIEGAIDGLCGRVGGSTGVLEADRVRTWEDA